MKDRFCQYEAKRRIAKTFPLTRVLFAAWAVLALAACQEATGPGDFLPGLTISTPETIHFTSNLPGGSNQIVVPVTITNGSDKTLNLAYCGEQLERISIVGWRTVYSPVCLATVHSLPPITAGTSLTFSFYASDTPPRYEGFHFTDSPNVYRVRLALWIVDSGASQPLPREASVTNPFKVEQ
ncbi:MAG TPA: hypothetical protein VGJ62_15385 [Gemmatimonadaceae bacterium]|jgi:hypothetical protein